MSIDARTKLVKRREELAGAAQHLLYELLMLQETAHALGTGDYPPGPLRNALLESFVIHARNVLHFLDPLNEKPSDVLAEHYLSEPSLWHEERGELPPVLTQVRHRVNKEVVHLTYDRLSVVDEARGWDHEAIADEVLARFVRFARLLSPSEAALLGIPESPGEHPPE